jgi:hypothetical protein
MKTGSRARAIHERPCSIRGRPWNRRERNRDRHERHASAGGAVGFWRHCGRSSIDEVDHRWHESQRRRVFRHELRTWRYLRGRQFGRARDVQLSRMAPRAILVEKDRACIQGDNPVSLKKFIQAVGFDKTKGLRALGTSTINVDFIASKMSLDLKSGFN